MTITRIALIGLRGAGKSAVGRDLAARLGLPRFDSDEEIALRVGRMPGEILRTDGEPEFRRVEEAVVLDLLGRPEGVVALGGGAILSEATRRALASWCVVLLDAPDEVLLERCRRDALSDADATRASKGPDDGDSPRSQRVDRPPLTSLSPAEEVAELRRIRFPLHQSLATLTLDTSGGTVEALVSSLLRELSGRRYSS